jgi:LacI family transcriptional regulator
MGRTVTIYDVSQAAGVSISTVSHTLNRPSRVHEATRKRVLEVIDRLGYQPKPAAMEMARKGTRRVGVIAPFSSYSSYMTRLAGLLEEAREQAYEVVVYDQESAATSTSPLLSSLPLTRRVDGLLVLGLPLDDGLAEQLLRQALPTVLVDSSHDSFDSITIDDRQAGLLVGRHLTGSGRRRIAYVSESQRSEAYLSQGQLRRAGVRDALVEAGLDPNGLQHVVTSNDLEGGRAAVRAVLDGAGLPDAFFAHHDAVAAGVLAECRAQGIAVPEQTAVVGFDDSELARALQITTIRQPLRESGRTGFRHLRELMDRRGPDERPDAQTVVEAPRHSVTLGVRLVPGATS